MVTGPISTGDGDDAGRSAFISRGYVGGSPDEEDALNLAVQQLPGGQPDPVGRARLIASVAARVLDGQAVAIHGPRGMGRTTFLEAVVATVPKSIDVRVQRLGVPGHGVGPTGQPLDELAGEGAVECREH